MVRSLQAKANPPWRNKLRITSEIILKISTISSKTKKKQKKQKTSPFERQEKKKIKEIIEWSKRIISIEYKDPLRAT